MKDGMAVRSDNLCELTGLGATDDGELQSFVMLLEKVNDVGSVRNWVDVHIGMTPLPHLHLAFEAMAVADGEYGGLA